MMTLRRLLNNYLGTIFLNKSLGVAVVALLLVLTLNSRASAQGDQAADYTRSSQPPFLNYQELVTLYQQETVEAQLAAQAGARSPVPGGNLSCWAPYSEFGY